MDAVAAASDSDEGAFPERSIHRAARWGVIDGLQREIDAGVDLDDPCEDGNALNILCGDERVYGGSEENRIRGLRMLIEAGASLNLDSMGLQPLATAAASGNLPVVQMLLEAGADVRETCEYGWTAVHSSVGADTYPSWFAGSEGPRRVRSAVNCTAALIAAGADLDAASRGGTTPLMVVARLLAARPSNLSTPLYAVLLRGGATLDRDKIEKRQGWTPYLDKVYQAGGWARYAQAHRTRLVATFAPKLRLPADVIPLVVEFWANVGMY